MSMVDQAAKEAYIAASCHGFESILKSAARKEKQLEKVFEEKC
jgi:hypothetical protein